MSVDSHLEQLRQRHETLGRKIEEQQKAPGSNDLEIAALKREKLHLKDEIHRIEHTH